MNKLWRETLKILFLFQLINGLRCGNLEIWIRDQGVFQHFSHKSLVRILNCTCLHQHLHQLSFGSLHFIFRLIWCTKPRYFFQSQPKDTCVISLHLLLNMESTFPQMYEPSLSHIIFRGSLVVLYWFTVLLLWKHLWRGVKTVQNFGGQKLKVYFGVYSLQSNMNLYLGLLDFPEIWQKCL